MNIIPLFSEIDDSFLAYENQKFPKQLPEIPDVRKKRGRPRNWHISEVMTLLITFHQSQSSSALSAIQTRNARHFDTICFFNHSKIQY